MKPADLELCLSLLFSPQRNKIPLQTFPKISQWNINSAINICSCNKPLYGNRTTNIVNSLWDWSRETCIMNKENLTRVWKVLGGFHLELLKQLTDIAMEHTFLFYWYSFDYEKLYFRYLNIVYVKFFILTK